MADLEKLDKPARVELLQVASSFGGGEVARFAKQVHSVVVFGQVGPATASICDRRLLRHKHCDLGRKIRFECNLSPQGRVEVVVAATARVQMVCGQWREVTANTRRARGSEGAHVALHGAGGRGRKGAGMCEPRGVAGDHTGKDSVWPSATTVSPHARGR